MITLGYIQPVGVWGVYVGHLPARDEGYPDPLAAYPKIHLKLRPCQI